MTPSQGKTVHFYDDTARTIVKTKTYRTRELAWEAIKRAQRAHKIAAYADVSRLKIRGR